MLYPKTQQLMKGMLIDRARRAVAEKTELASFSTEIQNFLSAAAQSCKGIAPEDGSLTEKEAFNYYLMYAGYVYGVESCVAKVSSVMKGGVAYGIY